MVSLIQEYAPSGPAVGSISFDFVTKSDGMALARQGDRQAPTLVALFRTGLVSWALLTECARMPSTGQPHAEHGTDQR